MEEAPIARDYLKSFYTTLEEHIRINTQRARDVARFSMGFLGVVGGGSAYVLTKDLGWCPSQKMSFFITSYLSFTSFLFAVLLSFIFIAGYRRKKPFPALQDPTKIMAPLDATTLQKFEEDLYKYYRDVRRKGYSKIRVYDVAFYLMFFGFINYGIAAFLIIIFGRW